jgi:DNA-binding transcriptional ArsR family regulator
MYRSCPLGVSPLLHCRLDTLSYFHKLGIMDERAAVAALGALAQEARLRVFRALVGAGPQGMTPGELSAMLDIPASTLSFHLKELMHAHLVSVERAGRNLNYRPALGRMNELLGYLTDHCCLGQPCSPPRGTRRASSC